ncbi:hypothetical protein THAOC_31038, partial [Thalassiosira oceanica]
PPWADQRARQPVHRLVEGILGRRRERRPPGLLVLRVVRGEERAARGGRGERRRRAARPRPTEHRARTGNAPAEATRAAAIKSRAFAAATGSRRGRRRDGRLECAAAGPSPGG